MWVILMKVRGCASGFCDSFSKLAAAIGNFAGRVVRWLKSGIQSMFVKKTDRAAKNAFTGKQAVEKAFNERTPLLQDKTNSKILGGAVVLLQPSKIEETPDPTPASQSVSTIQKLRTFLFGPSQSSNLKGIRNPGLACWSISTIQMLRTLPGIKAKLTENLRHLEGDKKKAAEALIKLFEVYESDSSHALSLAEKEFRGAICKAFRAFDNEPNVMHDANDLISAISELAFNDAGSRSLVVAISDLPSSGQGTGVYWSDFFKTNSFQDQTLASNSIELPEQVFLRFSRCGVMVDGINYKDQTPILLHQDQILGSSNALSVSFDHLGASYEFEVTGFIVHRGDKASGGHYVSYVHQPDGWYECNDAMQPKLLSKEDLQVKIQQAVGCQMVRKLCIQDGN